MNLRYHLVMAGTPMVPVSRVLFTFWAGIDRMNANTNIRIHLRGKYILVVLFVKQFLNTIGLSHHGVSAAPALGERLPRAGLQIGERVKKVKN